MLPRIFASGANWETSVDFGPFLAGERHTLAEYDAVLNSSSLITSVGFYSDDIFESLTDFKFLGTQYIFTPEPVYTAPTTMSRSDFSTGGAGATFTTTGFLPDETIDVFITEDGTQRQIDSITADVNGAIHYTYVHPDAGAALGNYRFTFVGSLPNFQFFTLALVDSTAAPELASTGVDTIGATVLASGLLLGGAGLMIAGRRRRAARSL